MDRCCRDVESTRNIYTKSLVELNSYNAKYMEDMNEVFARTQEFEAKRLAFFKKLLYDYHACVDATRIMQYVCYVCFLFCLCCMCMCCTADLTMCGA